MIAIADASNMPIWDLPWTAIAVAASIPFVYCMIRLLLGLGRAAARETPAPTGVGAVAQEIPAPAPPRTLTDDLCMVTSCTQNWTVDVHGWLTCADHSVKHTAPQTPRCKACLVAPATEVHDTLCIPCHTRIAQHFDEFVDQALAIVNGGNGSGAEVAQVGLAMWEIEFGQGAS